MTWGHESEYTQQQKRWCGKDSSNLSAGEVETVASLAARSSLVGVV